jgi:cardiolipin synthase C
VCGLQFNFVFLRNSISLGLLLVAFLLSFAQTISANEFSLLVKDQDALHARVVMIRNAKQEICLTTFSIDPGFVPTALLEQIRDRAKAGVRVRIIVDGLRSELTPNIVRYLAEGGIEIGVYHPILNTNPSWINRRLHSKLLVVDGNMMIIGSRNKSDKHFGLKPDSFVDYDAMVSGPFCGEAQQYFDDLWSSADVRPVRKGLIYRRSEGKPEEFCTTQHQQFERRYESQTDQSMPIRILNICSHEMCLLRDRDAAKSDRSMADAIEQMIDTSNRSVVIETPYPAFTDQFVELLRRTRERGVRVKLITNSLGTTNLVLVYAAYQRHKDKLIRAGVEIYEFTSPGVLHAKSMMIDDRIAMLGSYNFDARSENLNLELCLVTTNPQAVASIQSILGDHQSHSTRVDGSGIQAIPQIDFADKVKLRSAQLIAPLLRPAL